MKLSYTISGSSVRFEYTIPVSVYHTWTYVGMGLKSYEEGHSRKGSDFTTIDIREMLIEDRVGLSDTDFPVTDLSIGGKDSLKNEAMRMDEGYVLNFLWDRELNTGDTADVQLIPGNMYFAQWSVGNVEGGVFEQPADRGLAIFVFGACDDQEFLAVN